MKTTKPRAASSASRRPSSVAPTVAAPSAHALAPPPTPPPVVGIGASAGGLAAFEAFFSGMPSDADPGMAFVLVQHLAPDHKSILTELIRRCTRMPVFEVEDGMVVQANCVYIIPPNRDMAFLGGALQLLEPAAPRGQRLPIDFLFRSLAQDQGERAIGVILSGTGSDGTLGIRAIKGEGGMVLAQSTESTAFDGMPRSAMATGLVDFVLPPNEMPAQIIAYVTHAFGRVHLQTDASASEQEHRDDDHNKALALKKIFVLLRAQTSHDFSQYKPSTIHRRIERRMAVHQIESTDHYVKFLQQTPAEVESLFRDLLIGVTNFFRDPDVFELLEQKVIKNLFEQRPAGSVIRVWSTGCSTGEEAYSIAILLRERIDAIKQNYTVQVFATDIDSNAIATARAGVYPASIAADMTPERLARFFSIEADGSAYRIHKSIRDTLVFSEQNVIKDPPFSRLDLLCCRNLMIYLDAELQKKLIPLFHYALKPGGMMFLGTSEGIGDFGNLFTALDRKAKLYQRKELFPAAQPGVLSRFLPTLSTTQTTHLRPERKTEAPLFPVKMPLRELTEQALLRHLAPTSALINAEGDILYLHGRTGMYLELSPGEVGVSNILKMAREGLRRDLSIALRKAASSQEVIRCPGLCVKINERFSFVNLSVCPVTVGTSNTAESHLYLVVLEDAPEPNLSHEGLADVIDISNGEHLPSKPEASNDASALARIEALKRELRAKEEYLQSTHEELESSNEELKSSNEEMQSVNEELQSTNEELETSKEELQSVNEELATVNNELQTKVADLSRANNDMNNLLAGTGIGTVFVDHQLRILRFTPAASAIINLIISDVGRPVAHIVSNLVGYDALVADTQTVLNTLIIKEIDVQTKDGNWYAMRIQPYRTLDNVIEGAVISFTDITEIVRIRTDLQEANDIHRLAIVVRDASDAITVQTMTGHTLAWNPGAVRLYGWSEAEALQMNVRERVPANLREEALATLGQLSHANELAPYATQRLKKNGDTLAVSIVSTALINEAGEMYGIATTERAIEGVHHDDE